jgi:hypothetical protein
MSKQPGNTGPEMEGAVAEVEREDEVGEEDAYRCAVNNWSDVTRPQWEGYTGALLASITEPCRGVLRHAQGHLAARQEGH